MSCLDIDRVVELVSRHADHGDRVCRLDDTLVQAATAGSFGTS
jgi:hypothetical protein